MTRRPGRFPPQIDPDAPATGDAQAAGRRAATNRTSARGAERPGAAGGFGFPPRRRSGEVAKRDGAHPAWWIGHIRGTFK